MSHEYKTPPDNGPTMDDYPLVKLAEMRMRSLERAGIKPEILVVGPDFHSQFKSYMTEYLGFIFDPELPYSECGVLNLNGRVLEFFTRNGGPADYIQCYGSKTLDPAPSE